MSKKDTFTFIDLFAGIGGFHIGASNFGGKLLGFSEVDNNAIEHYCVNFEIPENLNLGDITRINELPAHDLLCGGVPCQSWSIAGRKRGFDDDRGQLWNDTIFLLNKTRPKAFIFENVKGLVQPRNKDAFQYILDRIEEAGYHATYMVINSHDFGVLQNRERVYVVGFKEKKYFDIFKKPTPLKHYGKIHQVIENIEVPKQNKKKLTQKDLFGKSIPMARTKFQKTDEFNDFFLFNDIRNGHTTIHSWDLIETSDFEKEICYCLLRNRRKKKYGILDGNPLSISHFKELIPAIEKSNINKLLKKGIFKEVEYGFEILDIPDDLEPAEKLVLDQCESHLFSIDQLKMAKVLWKEKISFSKVLPSLIEKKVIRCIEKRYDFKFTKISSGIFGINRIYLPSSDIYSTLVASDTNDFVAEINISADDPDEYKQKFIDEVYKKGKYRKISKIEACLLQGFPKDFILPEKRSKWMKLLGNSVSVPVIEAIVSEIAQTGVFKSQKKDS